MSAVGSGEVLRPILLRSSTPGPNEKVMRYLQGIEKEGADDGPPPSIIDHDEYRHKPSEVARNRAVLSPVPRSHASDVLNDLANSPLNYDDLAQPNMDVHDDEISSVVQEQSEAETPVPIPEPGPFDPPGPRYESYDSGPSFGNMGPLPLDDHDIHNPYVYSTWAPEWNIGKQEPPKIYSTYPPPDPVFGSSQASVNINIESPSQISRNNPSSESPIKTKKGTSRAASPPNAESESGPKSPISRKSHVTGKSRATEKGTVYPPLPPSRMGDSVIDGPMSPPQSKVGRSKAPSITPSESPSQVKSRTKSPPRKDPSVINKSDLGTEAARSRQVPASRSPPPVGSVMSGGHQNRPFSPYRHAPTNEDLLYAAVRGRALVIPEDTPSTQAKTASAAMPSPPASPKSRRSKVPSHLDLKQPSVVPSHRTGASKVNGARDGDKTPTPSRPHTPDEQLNAAEQKIVDTIESAARTPRTSYYSPSILDPDMAAQYHDMELCVLFAQLNDTKVHEFVKKAVRKAVRQRVKRLGMKYDNESIKEYQRHHNHDPTTHISQSSDNPPSWVADIKRELVLMQQRIEGLGENLHRANSQNEDEGKFYEDDGQEYSHTPATQSVNIRTQPTGTLADSMYQIPETDEDAHDHEFDEVTTQQRYEMTDQPRDDSPGQQYLEEELYKLRQKPKATGSQSGASHRTWEVTREHGYDDADDEDAPQGVPTIPSDAYDEHHVDAHQEGAETGSGAQWNAGEYEDPQQQLPPWQRIHQRLLNWAITWPTSALDAALNSTTRGHQVDEVALSVWSTQTYKRYVRSRLTDSPQGVVDRLFVPPNVADAISNAVFNGRHGDACGMLRDLWNPFGLDGMPRLIVVLAKHRSDESHWVVHRYSLPDGSLTTYDTYPERTLPDGRPLGWWFAIRVAWPNAIYPSPDHLMQKMVRLHRPQQLPIDNSVSAAGIWRNILMGSRAERSLDLERLRDLINTEVKNLRQRKQLGKLSIAPPRPTWEDMN